MIKKKLKSFARKIILFLMPGLAPFLIFVFVLGNILTPITTIMHAIKKDLKGAWVRLWETTLYDDEPEDAPEKRVAWNDGIDEGDPLDPDMTALFYQRLIDERKKIDDEILMEDATNYTPEAINYLSKRTEDSTENLDKETQVLWYDVMRDEHTLLAPEDMIYLVEGCYKKNEKMFEMEGVVYEYLKKEDGHWGLEWDPVTGQILKYHWADTSYKGTGKTDNDPDDLIYQDLSRIKIEGEYHPDYPGVRRFAMHWPDAVSLATFFSTENWENWGESEEAEYVPHEKAMGINGVDDYYLTDRQLQDVLDLYEYHFDYYYDGAADTFHSSYDTRYIYPSLALNVYDLGYRFKLIPYELERFVPESAPKYIYNTWESYSYVYTPTSKVPNYCPEEMESPPQTPPPDGQYCCGRWQVIDPYFYIEEVAAMCPWYRERIDYGVISTYEWVHEMIDRINVYIDLLPTTAAYNRSRDFEELADLYTEQTIKVVYEGTLCDEMWEYTAALEEWLAETRPEWTLEIDFESKSTDEFIEVDESLSNVPFSSYGVTYSRNVTTEMYHRGGETERRRDSSSGDVWISQEGGHVVEDWLYLYDGADEPLDVPVRYSREQILTLLAYFEELSGGHFPFTSALEAVYQWNQATGFDVCAIMAIILTEGTFKPGDAGGNMFNFFNLMGAGGLQNLKARFGGDFSAALIHGFDQVLNWWRRGQNTYYTMCFNQYGYPQNHDEAEAAKPGITMSYCPWWDDTGYISTGYNSEFAWCNKSGANWMKLRSIIGSPVTLTPKPDRSGGADGGRITINLDGVIVSLYPSEFMTYEELLASTANPEYYMQYARCVEIDGRLYFYEIQSSGNTAWSNWGPNMAGGNQIDQTGCFWYAVGSMISAKTGKCYTIEDIVRNQFGSDAVISVDSNGKFNVTDKNGKVLQGTGTGGGAAAAQTKLNEAGIKATTRDLPINSNTMNTIAKGVSEGKSYLYYYNWRTNSGGTSQHWVSINGISKSGKLIVTGDLGSGIKEIDSLSDLSKSTGGIALTEVEYAN